MRKPFDRVWYLSENKPVEGIIYFIECYIKSIENPDKNKKGNKLGYYKLSNEIKIVYYIINEYNFKHTSPVGLKESADRRSKNQIFNTRKELCESLMED